MTKSGVGPRKRGAEDPRNRGGQETEGAGKWRTSHGAIEMRNGNNSAGDRRELTSSRNEDSVTTTWR